MCMSCRSLKVARCEVIKKAYLPLSSEAHNACVEFARDCLGFHWILQFLLASQMHMDWYINLPLKIASVGGWSRLRGADENVGRVINRMRVA